MFELIYYRLFLLLYGFGAWIFFNGLQDLITNASKVSKPQPSASPFNIGNMKPRTVFCTANCLHDDDDDEIEASYRNMSLSTDNFLSDTIRASFLISQFRFSWKY